MSDNSGIAGSPETTSEPAPSIARTDETSVIPDANSIIRFTVPSMVLGMVGLIMTSLHAWGNTTAYLLNFLWAGIIGTYVVMRRDAFLMRLLAATLVAGFVQLYGDWYCIEVVPTLVYNHEGPFLASSPFYMPFSWTLVLWLFTLITHWVDRRYGLIAAIGAGLLVGTLYLPLCEHLAYSAGWWQYQGVPMLGRSPYFLIVGHPLIIASLPLLGRVVEKRGLVAASVAGVAVGIWIYVAARIGLALTG